ncbi:MAG: hypothetical protein A2X05_00300 [Bacteroidetes bacterium GWE2_41_25]|nr:MAG: hypothetical protein A2X03_01840 [Bacteroidetes bacterium GWA2_40_15]OFX85842.1 MAG: hypothetical protein A2X06_11025 [Bacteroidetes bacterium GWC2_40_22]OFX97447.1 MAG: hypothetical protein A2X05_00300 [Bacteroidetes bacterium GWE2_41_25]OFY59740.1 MAG: hypothetical protein A2X04_11380 [Bacteroidetes bacterium GWF2_41_9]HAM09777.1 hypothetical protein [Bacteroidales bacterium]
MITMRSEFLRLNTRDFIRGLIVVVICTFVTGLYQVIASGGQINWFTIKPVVIAVVGSAISYLTKNLLTNSKGDFMKSEQDGSDPKTGTQVI